MASVSQTNPTACGPGDTATADPALPREERVESQEKLNKELKFCKGLEHADLWRSRP